MSARMKRAPEPFGTKRGDGGPHAALTPDVKVEARVSSATSDQAEAGNPTTR
jgi:hypothetical protein